MHLESRKIVMRFAVSLRCIGRNMAWTARPVAIGCGLIIMIASAMPITPGPLPRSVSATTTGTRTILQTVRVGTNPVEALPDERTHRVFVLSSGAPSTATPGVAHYSLAVLDTLTGRVLRTIRFGPHEYIFAATVDERLGRVFLAVNSAVTPTNTPSGIGSLLLLNEANGAILRRIVVGPTIDDFGNDERTGRLFVSTSAVGKGARSLRVLSAMTGTLLRTFVVDDQGLAIDTRTGQIAVLEPNDLRILDPVTGRGRTLPVVGDNIAIDSRPGHILVDETNTSGGISLPNIQVIDEASGKNINLLLAQSSDSDGGQGLLIDEQAGLVFTNYQDSYRHVNVINVVSTRDGHSVTQLVLDADGNAAVSLDIDERANHLYVADAQTLPNSTSTYGPTQVFIYDASRGNLVRVIATPGIGPPAITVDAQDRRVFVANSGGDTVTILDTTHV